MSIFQRVLMTGIQNNFVFSSNLEPVLQASFICPLNVAFRLLTKLAVFFLLWKYALAFSQNGSIENYVEEKVLIKKAHSLK